VCVLVGAAAVCAFVQENITGPPFTEDWTSWLPESLKSRSEVSRPD
jgi:hypothetical protein